MGTVGWREFVGQHRVRVAHRDYWSSEPRPEEWLLIEWPSLQAEPTRYGSSTLPAHNKLPHVVCLHKHHWIMSATTKD